MKNSVTIALLALGTIGYAQVKDSVRYEKKIDEVELFGEKKKKEKGMEIITRMPLKVRDQIQSISVISHKAIEDMGALTITDAAKNIPGVVLFSTYGGGAESMSIRGYRGTPVLKNGVLMNSDFRTSSMTADMQGVESMQVIRGSVAVTQGIGSALGAAGGVINITTKKPKFRNFTNVGFRYGSWEMYRPTIDFERVLDSKGQVSVRMNASYQNNKSYADYVKGERFYVNPSLAFRPDNKTEIVTEMDYMYNERTPNRGTVNLATDDVNAIYDLPKNKFLGFASDYSKEKSFNFGIYADRKLSDKLRVRVAYLQGDKTSDGISSGRLDILKGSDDYKKRQRTISKSSGEDHSKVFQADLIGQEIKTGILKHTFQVGFDWKESYIITDSYALKATPKDTKNNALNVDVIDVTKDVSNIFPSTVNTGDIIKVGSVQNAKSPIYGVSAQEVMGIGKYVKAVLGVRYSSYQGNNQAGKRDALDPLLGLMISPLENVNIYGSYTTTTSLRGNDRPLLNGGTVGASITRQWETGFKSDWFDERLRFNLNLYSMDMNNLSYEVLNTSGKSTGYYDFAGDLTRQGVEIDLIGRILPELEVMAGYSYLDAKYKNSPAYVDGSRPMMAAQHTGNVWLNYTVRHGALKGLNFGGGAYYVGDRPVNEYTQKVVVHNTKPGVKPFTLDAYTTLNLQVGYSFKNVSIKVFANNITDAIGYNAYYRGGFLNRNDPRNFAVQLNYKF